MKIAVTGAFSYSGKYITRRLLAQGHEVITLTGHPHREDPFAGRVTYFKVISGVLRNDANLYNSRNGGAERLSHIGTLLGKTINPITELHAGDIGSPDILDELGRIARVVAVRGNNDRAAWAHHLPERETIQVCGMSIFIGQTFPIPRGGRPSRRPHPRCAARMHPASPASGRARPASAPRCRPARR